MGRREQKHKEKQGGDRHRAAQRDGWTGGGTQIHRKAQRESLGLPHVFRALPPLACCSHASQEAQAEALGGGQHYGREVLYPEPVVLPQDSLSSHHLTKARDAGKTAAPRHCPSEETEAQSKEDL